MKEPKYIVKVDGEVPDNDELVSISIKSRKKNGHLYYTVLFPEDVKFIEVLALNPKN